MAKEKKTIQVQEIKDYANLVLSNTNISLDEKMGVITMTEHILHKSNAYNGFMFLSLPNGNAPEFYTYEWATRKYF
jgi:hypothetical protein